MLARWWPKLALALVLALVASAAHAWPCYPRQANIEGVPVPLAGKGTPLIIEEDKIGRAYGWWCPMHYTAPEWVFVTGYLSDFDQNWLKIAAQLALATEADRQAAKTKYLTRTFPRNASGGPIVPFDLYPVHMLVYNQLVAARPPDPIWKVAPNPGFTTRPAFAYSGGIRATVATARATVDAACYCDTRDVVGSTVYCAVNTARTWMSVCTKRN